MCRWLAYYGNPIRPEVLLYDTKHSLVEQSRRDRLAGGFSNADGFGLGRYGLALVDIAGFDRAIWERCEGLRHHKIPFLVLSPRQSAAIQQASLTHGARGVLIKPLVVRELLGLIRSLLEEEADQGEAEG